MKAYASLKSSEIVFSLLVRVLAKDWIHLLLRIDFIVFQTLLLYVTWFNSKFEYTFFRSLLESWLQKFCHLIFSFILFSLVVFLRYLLSRSGRFIMALCNYFVMYGSWFAWRNCFFIVACLLILQGILVQKIRSSWWIEFSTSKDF